MGKCAREPKLWCISHACSLYWHKAHFLGCSVRLKGDTMMQTQHVKLQAYRAIPDGGLVGSQTWSGMLGDWQVSCMYLSLVACDYRSVCSYSAVVKSYRMRSRDLNSARHSPNPFVRQATSSYIMYHPHFVVDSVAIRISKGAIDQSEIRNCRVLQGSCADQQTHTCCVSRQVSVESVLLDSARSMS